MHIFASPNQQIENIRIWNERRSWGLTQAHFDRLPEPPAPPDERFPLAATVLVPYLPPLGKSESIPRHWSLVDVPPQGQCVNSTYRTCIELALLIRKLYPELSEGLSQFPQAYLLPNADEPQPGLRWEIIDLGANLGQNPNACEDRQLSPHAGVLAAICHFPEWMKLVSSEELPGVWISGYGDSYKLALFRNHSTRCAPRDSDGKIPQDWRGNFELGGWCPGMGNSAGNRARRLLAVPRFR